MESKINVYLVVLILMSTRAFATNQCNFNQWISYKGTQLQIHRTKSVYMFSSDHMEIDADGAPNAYHPDDIGIDFLTNSGYPNKSWWSSVLVPDPNNPSRAYTQTSGEFAGYFVSKTSLQNKAEAVTNPARYVDARNLPYLVLPGSFYQMKGTGRLGDPGYAINLSSGEHTSFVVADIGPSNARLGEVSIALAEGLGGKNVSPRDGAGIPQGKMLYIVFPYASRNHSWPLTVGEIQHFVDSLIERTGGIETILACLHSH